MSLSPHWEKHEIGATRYTEYTLTFGPIRTIVEEWTVGECSRYRVTSREDYKPEASRWLPKINDRRLSFETFPTPEAAMQAVENKLRELSQGILEALQ